MPDTHAPRIEFSPRHGVRDLPEIDARHESNVRGIYVVGDLADAPVVKMAFHQGYAVARQVARTLGQPAADPELLDVLVVGAGPAGVGAALALEELGRRYLVVEREAPFSTIAHFQPGKQIFGEPRDLDVPGGFGFEDAPKELLVARWQDALTQERLRVRVGEEVVDARRQGDHFVIRTRGPAREGARAVGGVAEGSTWRARRIILAVGKRGQPTRLGIPGEDLPHVRHVAEDPALFAGRRVVVVGGGDSAVEAATAAAERGARVLLSYRGPQIVRARAKNRDKLAKMAAAGQLALALGTRPVAISPAAVRLVGPDGATREVPADDVVVQVGTGLPRPLLRRLGIRTKGETTAARAVWIAAFALLTYLFYVLKQGLGFFPFGPGHPLDAVPAALQVDLGFREVGPGFWGTTIYALLVLVFAVRALRRHPSPEQRRRYLSLVAFQWVFLFGVPELLAPLVIERPWKLYALSVPWPLSIWSLVDAPAWAGGDTLVALGWIAVGALSAFVLVPWYVRRQGQRFCSYLCGCGALAETLGDFWRDLAPRGRTAKQAEILGRVPLVLAVPVTLLILNDAWQFVASGALYQVKAFAQHWYGLVVDFGLASMLGVALYPYLGNRVWCRFFCPLRAFMEELSRRFATLVITPDERCIGCNACTRYCQMGIDVQRFAQRQEVLGNHNSACIQCGVCVEVCPMDVLRVGRAGSPVELVAQEGLLVPPRAAWER